jgi:hypothetical protein
VILYGAETSAVKEEEIGGSGDQMSTSYQRSNKTIENVINLTWTVTVFVSVDQMVFF